MATRALQRRAAVPLAAAALASALVLQPRPVLAASPDEFESRKPIYDDPNPQPPPSSSAQSDQSPSFSSSSSLYSSDQKTHHRSPTPTDRLAVYIRKGRLFLHSQVRASEDKLNQAMDSAFHLEQSFTGTVASLAPPRESGERLIPGTIYVLVAAMGGSILTRNRNIVFRAAAPFALGLGAAWAVLPITTRNVADLAWRYEQRLPALAESHIKAREAVERTWYTAKAHSQMSVVMVDEKVTSAREAIEGWVRKGK